MLSQATVSLRENGSRSPRLDAELLLAEALGVGRAELFRDPARVPTHEEAATFEVLLRRRLAHEPVAYILGAARSAPSSSR